MCAVLRTVLLDLLDRVVDRGRRTTVGPGERDVLGELPLGPVPFGDHDRMWRARLLLRRRENLDVGRRGCVVRVASAVVAELAGGSVHVRDDVAVDLVVGTEGLRGSVRGSGRQAHACDGCRRAAGLGAARAGHDLRGIVLRGLFRLRRGRAGPDASDPGAGDGDDRDRQEFETLHETDPPSLSSRSHPRRAEVSTSGFRKALI